MGSEQLLDPSPDSSPASTPDEERCLAVPKRKPPSDSQRWPAVLWSLTPFTLVLVSIVQVLLFLGADAQLSRLLRWEPVRRTQVWRVVTYMLLHRGPAHLALNVLLQLLLAAPLAREQGGRYGVVYAVGGVAGALGAALLQPQPLVGASAGVYALLISHLAHLYLNMSRLQYRKYRVFSVCVLAASDIAFCCLHARTASISVGAHGAGGLSGALVGLLAYRGDSRRYVRVVAALLVGMLIAGAVLALAVLPDAYFTT